MTDFWKATLAFLGQNKGRIATTLALEVLIVVGITYIWPNIRDLPPLTGIFGKRITGDSKSAIRLRSRLEGKSVSSTESELLQYVVHPEDPTSSVDQNLDEEEQLIFGNGFKKVGGYEDVIKQLKDQVIIPLRMRARLLAQGTGRERKMLRMVQPPKGVLFHGPPGCGKTTLAKAMAAEADAVFFNINAGNLLSKWYGESEKMVDALFSLAQKVSPAIIFFDEFDSFLRERTMQDHEATAKVKGLFLSLWDGLVSDPEQNVIVIGATNRVGDLDKAARRRMPVQVHVKPPSTSERLAILKLALKDLNTNEVHMEQFALATEGLTGSDLTEVCRGVMNDIIMDAYATVMDKVQDLKLRPVNDADMERNIIRLCKAMQNEPRMASATSLSMYPRLD